MALGIQAAGMDRVDAPTETMLDAEIVRDPTAAEVLWRRMEADPASLQTPYQRYDWTIAYLRASGQMESSRVAILRDRGGRPQILLPLTLQREYGLRVARTVGDTHANYHMPLFASRDAAAIPARDIAGALIRAGRSSDIDAYALRHQPRIWDGSVNPLAARGAAEASDAYGLTLDPDPETTLRRVFSADARKKLRSKEKRLIEAHGPIAYRRAETPEEAVRFLSAFYAHKAARFAGMGVADPYADPSIRDFLTAAADGENPAVEIHALCLAGSGRVLATFGGAVSAQRYSGMMTAFDPDPVIARYSPGDLLLQHLVRDQAARGRLGFDLGVGEARYKASICDETISLVESIIPVTLAGRTYGAIRQGIVRTKRRIKRDPRLFAALQRLRKLRGV
ncbi:Acetyltransferase involved in cellulose biosynthesis, CelD/BcsL family [Methylobacterium phyllostachyos]|uniref:Acetyltransferase involved in cellulose biosynthesis, CelD/BcsL family n=1 Tax=Methylobacterium phyllostachyos TaxID=582672 RepID=A0A1G9UET3_9HYPH|nr:GNAT family N-acetyltransferase [Methylobacterium phyllostachyos]SDM58254.1 Acetyltransferase involved in cellulose biosynthesis, CelD/BcsL family [Methylobacterium phyllostachyos]